jgi:xeroderma pigmentosum group C-complementing protein
MVSTRRGKAARGISRTSSSYVSSRKPNIYQELLEEAESASQSSATEDGRSIKKRRIGGRLVVTETPVEIKAEDQSVVATDKSPITLQQNTSTQVAYNDFDDDSDDSDIDWEDVELAPESQVTAKQNLGDLDLVLDGSEKAKKADTPRRNVLTAADRKIRLDIHKMHIIALLSHVNRRNHWCSDFDIQVSQTTSKDDKLTS